MTVEEEGLKDMLILQRGGTNSAFSRFISCMTSWIKSGLAQVVLSHGNLLLLTIHHFIYCSKEILKNVYFQPLPTTLPEIAGLLRATATVIAPAMFIDV